jgi:hypothetical protein
MDVQTGIVAVGGGANTVGPQFQPTGIRLKTRQQVSF